MQLVTKKTSRKLIIELAKNAISVVSLAGGSSHLNRIVVQSAEDRLSLVDTVDLSKRLSEVIREYDAGSSATATICIPRNVACFHVIELPKMSQHDLVLAVNLEMESIYGEECSQYVWDFVHTGVESAAHAYAVIVCVPKHILESITSALDRAEISTERITLAEFGYGAAVSSRPGLVQILAYRQNRLDIALSHRGTILQSQTIAVHPSQACDFARIQGELRRLNASLPESLQVLVPTSVLLVGHHAGIDEDVETGEFESSLIEACRIHEFEIEPFTLEEFFDFRGRPDKRVDLAHPRKSSPPSFSRRHQITLASAMALSLAVACWAINQYRAARLSDQIRATEQRIEDSEKQISALSTQLEAAALLNQWDESNVDWSQQIHAISEQVAQTKDCYLVRLQMDNQNLLQRSPVARIEGRSRTAQSILQMIRDLSASHPSLSVNPNGIEPNSVDQDFATQFRVEITETPTPKSAVSETDKDQES